jgi:hypothetical protein
MFAAREAYLQCQVLLLPVAAHDLAYHASPLLNPVMLSYPHPHANARLFWSHDAPALRSYAPHRDLLVRLWDEFFVGGHLYVHVVVGAGVDDLLKLRVGGSYAKVVPDEVISEQGKHGSIVFGFQAKTAVAQQRAHLF